MPVCCQRRCHRAANTPAMLPAAVLPPHCHHCHAAVTALLLPRCHRSAATTAALLTPPARLPATAALPLTRCCHTAAVH